MAKHQFLYSGNINKVKFNLSGSDASNTDSYVPIISYDLFHNNAPYEGGVYDAHMGTTDDSYRCLTCHNNKRNCIGHEGNIKLNYPIWNTLAVNEGRKWLKLICFSCGHPIIDDKLFLRYPRNQRLDEASKLARGSNKRCVHCNTVHPIIKKDPKETLMSYAEFYDDKRIVDSWIVYPHIIAEIFNRITDETVVKLGKQPNSHPRNYILYDIKVPSVAIRPDVKKIGGGRSTNDDLTTMLQIMIKKNEMMPSILPTDIDVKLDKAIWDINNAYYDFIKAGGDASMISLAKRLKGKFGRFRKNQMGKRSRNMCRSTITGDPKIKIDEVGVPLTFARTIQIEETVQEYNKKRLLGYIQNGRKKYPGATKIIKKNTGAEYDILKRDISLENGDTILRDMIDGDPVNFNRQPSLMVSNITTHKAKVMLDPTIHTLGMNVIICPYYNADFDGDAMHLIVNTGLAARNEIAELSSVPNWIISHTTSNPAIGQADDSIIGTAELTRSNVNFDKYHAMLLYQHSTFLPSFSDVGKRGITGRECVSKLLQETPINFTRNTEWYKPNMAPYVDYDPTEIKVVIDQGNILSGVLDKKSIGKGANGGIYHLIANEYSAEKALDAMFNMQQMAISYILQFGYTIGIMDMMIDQKSKEEVDKISADIINKSYLITERLHNGEIIPPIGKTVEEFYEEQQINTLSIFDDFTEPILKAIDPKTNNLFKLIMFGSKGKIEHMFNMVSAIGQKLINGDRILHKFGFKRVLAYYPRFDTSPEARGFIPNSYLTGMNSKNYICNADASRFDLISKALSTSITGEQNRKSIKSLESIIANNHRACLKNKNIIQFVYGDDYLDPRKVLSVVFPTVMSSDAEFKSEYLHKDFVEFYESMRVDRLKYREIFMNVENINVKEPMTAERKMPMDPNKIINNVIRAYKDKLVKPDAKTLAAMVKHIEDFIQITPYILINKIQEAARSPVHSMVSSACWLVVMLIRSYLHPNALIKHQITPEVLTIITDTIRFKYTQALVDAGTGVGIIAAQSFSEPLTQYMLDAHHRSASGGTKNSGMTRVKEVLGAKPLEKMSDPRTLIPVLPEYSRDYTKVQQIANNIEVMRFRQFVSGWQIFFERFAEPVHSKYKHEAKFIAEFRKLNPLLKPPGDLIKWCLRFSLNKTNLILKNMSLDLIIMKLREIFTDTFIVYTPENAAQIIIRVYFRNSMFKGHVSVNEIKSYTEEINNTIIRGVNGIVNTKVVELLRSEVKPNGSVARAEKLYGIASNGTNLRGLFANPYLDHKKILTDAIQETARVFGIEAARQSVISELREQVDSCNHRHYLIYADEMTYNGKVTSIERSGLRARERSNVLLRVGFGAPLNTLEEAAINSMEDAITGVTAPLLVGNVPKLGTLYNSFHINEEFVKANIKRPDDYIENLF